jgi:hypothetical protein
MKKISFEEEHTKKMDGINLREIILIFQLDEK